MLDSTVRCNSPPFVPYFDDFNPYTDTCWNAQVDCYDWNSKLGYKGQLSKEAETFETGQGEGTEDSPGCQSLHGV